MGFKRDGLGFVYLLNDSIQVILIQKGKIIQGELYNVILQKCVLSSPSYVIA